MSDILTEFALHYTGVKKWKKKWIAELRNGSRIILTDEQLQASLEYSKN